MNPLTPLQVARTVRDAAGADALAFALEVVREVSQWQAADAVHAWRSARVTELCPVGYDNTAAIIAAVCKHYGVTDAEMRRRQSYRRTSNARRMCWALMRFRLGLSWSDIGDRYNRDHTTVLATVRKIDRTSAEWLALNSLLNQIDAPEVAEAAE